MSTQDASTPTDTRLKRIIARVLAPTSPIDHYVAIAAYANELADLYRFTSPTHAASGRKVSGGANKS